MATLRARQAPTYDSSALRIPLLHEARELYRYRFLVRNLVARDLKVRYKRSSIGFIWVMLNPLLTMIVLTIAFSEILRVQAPHFPVYILSGTLLWNLFSQGSNAAMSSIQDSGHILRKLYVPPTAFVASAIGSALVNFVFALVPLIGVALFDGLQPSLYWLYLPIPALLLAIFTFGVGLIVGGLIVFFHDTFEIYQVFLNAYYFLTPIIYAADRLPEPLRTIEQYNPLTMFLDSFRGVLMQGQLPPLELVGKTTIIALIALLLGWIFFTRLEDRFAYHF